MQSKKILLIDDSQTIRKQAESILQGAGYQVLVCEDGFSALARMADFAPDLVISDIEMPRLDGYQTLALIRANPRFKDVPVLMLTSKSGVFAVARGQLIGCTDYLIKPMDKTVVLERLAHYLGEPA